MKEASSDRSRPNFLFISTDQQRWDAMGFLNPAIRTPTMDRLAREGMHFERMYPTNSICMPSRSSMITGRSQRGHQVFNHDVNMSEAIPVLGDGLSEAGYATSLIGKAHFKTADLEDILPDHPPEGSPTSDQDGLWYGPYYGFEYAEIHTGHAYPAGHWRVWLERNHPEGLELWRRENGLGPDIDAMNSWKNALPAEWHYTHWTADRTIAWLRRRKKQQPFFLWMSFADPHHPFAPPRPYCDMYDYEAMPEPIPPPDVSKKPPPYQRDPDGRPHAGYNTAQGWSGPQYQEIVAHYYGLTTFIDDAMARVMEELEAQGLIHNTHIIFTSDHGEGLKDHGIAGKPALSYEAVNRVPMLWRHPPTVKAGSICPGVMTQLDLTPTFLDLAGAKPLLGMEGRSFAPLLEGRTDHHRDAVIVERISAGRAQETDSETMTAKEWSPQTGFDDEGNRYDLCRVKMLVTDKWKLLHYGSAPYGELYDVVNDPDDTRNLWDDPDYAGVRRELTDRLLEELIDTELGDPVRILKTRAPSGALRDARLIEPQPVERSDLGRQLRGIQDRAKAKS